MECTALLPGQLEGISLSLLIQWKFLIHYETGEGLGKFPGRFSAPKPFKFPHLPGTAAGRQGKIPPPEFSPAFGRTPYLSP